MAAAEPFVEVKCVISRTAVGARDVDSRTLRLIAARARVRWRFVCLGGTAHARGGLRLAHWLGPESEKVRLEPRLAVELSGAAKSAAAAESAAAAVRASGGSGVGGGGGVGGCVGVGVGGVGVGARNPVFGGSFGFGGIFEDHPASQGSEYVIIPRYHRVPHARRHPF